MRDVVRTTFGRLTLLGVCACGAPRDVPREEPSFTLAQFQALRWLEGTWRGSANAEAPFYEGYHFRSDTLLRILYYADSTVTQAVDSGSVYLRNGQIYHEAGGGVWRTVSLDTTGIAFEPQQGVTNFFSWTRETADRWVATLRTPDAAETVYRLERWRR